MSEDEQALAQGPERGIDGRQAGHLLGVAPRLRHPRDRRQEPHTQCGANRGSRTGARRGFAVEESQKVDEDRCREDGHSPLSEQRAGADHPVVRVKTSGRGVTGWPERLPIWRDRAVRGDGTPGRRASGASCIFETAIMEALPDVTAAGKMAAMTPAVGRGLTMRAALALGFGATFGLWVFAGYYFTQRMADVQRESAAVNRRYMEAQELLSSIRTQVLLGSLSVRDALLAPDAEPVDAYRRQVEDTYASVDDAL